MLASALVAAPATAAAQPAQDAGQRERAGGWSASVQNPDVLAPECDSVDRLHPNDTGYRAMATAVNPFDL